jgi:hypothetical protein
MHSNSPIECALSFPRPSEHFISPANLIVKAKFSDKPACTCSIPTPMDWGIISQCFGISHRFCDLEPELFLTPNVIDNFWASGAFQEYEVAVCC